MELKIDEQQQAQNLYYQSALSNAEIAKIVGVSTRTISRWVTKENWKRIKDAARHAPSALIEKLYCQLNELLDYIASREPGQRFATKDEADTIRKLTSAIQKLKEQTGLCESIDLMMRFTTYVAAHNLELAQDITREADSFMKGSKAELHKPFELSYGKEDNDCRYEDDALASLDDEMPSIDTTGQSAIMQAASSQPLPVKDMAAMQQPGEATSLSSKNISGAQETYKEPAPPTTQEILDSWERYVQDSRNGRR